MICPGLKSEAVFDKEYLGACSGVKWIPAFAGMTIAGDAAGGVHNLFVGVQQGQSPSSRPHQKNRKKQVHWTDRKENSR